MQNTDTVMTNFIPVTLHNGQGNSARHRGRSWLEQKLIIYMEYLLSLVTFLLGHSVKCVFVLSGELKTLLPLDREEEEAHKMKVRALDGGGRFCEAEVEITVEDVNDNAPQFTSDPYTFTVFENTEINTPVSRLYASDLDTGKIFNIQIK